MQGSNVRQVAGEMDGANGQGLTSSGNAVLDNLRARKGQQPLLELELPRLLVPDLPSN